MTLWKCVTSEHQTIRYLKLLTNCSEEFFIGQRSRQGPPPPQAPGASQFFANQGPAMSGPRMGPPNNFGMGQTGPPNNFGNGGPPMRPPMGNNFASNRPMGRSNFGNQGPPNNFGNQGPMGPPNNFGNQGPRMGGPNNFGGPPNNTGPQMSGLAWPLTQKNSF